MKKIFVLTILLISTLWCFSQFSQKRILTNTETLAVMDGGAQVRYGFVNGVHTDTTAANSTAIKYYNGAQIYTRGDRNFWLRDSVLNMWVRMAKYSDVSLTLQDVILAGYYVHDTSIYAGQNFKIRWDYAGAGNAVGQYNSGTNSMVFYNIAGNHGIDLDFSMLAGVGLKKFKYRNSGQTLDTLATLYDIRTGGGTPTLQQVFNTEVGGSVLTKNDTIDVNSRHLRFEGTSGLIASKVGINVLDDFAGGGQKLSLGYDGVSGAITFQNGSGFRTTLQNHIGTGYYNIELPNTGNSNDTLATLYDIRAGGGGASNLSWDATNHEVDISGGGTSAVIPYATGSADGIVSQSSQTFVGLKTFNTGLTSLSTIRATSNTAFLNTKSGSTRVEIGRDDDGYISLINDGSPDWISTLKAQSTSDNKLIYLPNGNATDTLATKADVRAGGGGFNPVVPTQPHPVESWWKTTTSFASSVSSDGMFYGVSGAGATAIILDVSIAKDPLMTGIKISTGTATNGRGHIYAFAGGPYAAVSINSSYRYSVGFNCLIDTVGDVTNNYNLYCGLVDDVASLASVVDGAFFRYNYADSSGKWIFCTRNNSSTTEKASNVTVAINTLYELVVSVIGSKSYFYINGDLKDSISTDIPSGASRATSIGLGINKTAGTFSRNVYVEWGGYGRTIFDLSNYFLYALIMGIILTFIEKKMKKIIVFVFTLISIQSFGQNKLYAIRGNTDGTLDSFYVKPFTDSVVDKNNSFVLRSKSYYDQFYDPVFPVSFGKFILCADNIWRNGFALYGVRILVIPISVDAGANLVLTDQPNSEQPLANSQRSGVRVPTLGYTEFRVTAVVMASSASANNPRLYLQYSTDAVNWNGDSGAGNISLSSTGAKETSWIIIPDAAKGDIYVRVAQHGGNGTADPALGTVTIQLR